MVGTFDSINNILERFAFLARCNCASFLDKHNLIVKSTAENIKEVCSGEDVEIALQLAENCIFELKSIFSESEHEHPDITSISLISCIVKIRLLSLTLIPFLGRYVNSSDIERQILALILLQMSTTDCLINFIIKYGEFVKVIIDFSGHKNDFIMEISEDVMRRIANCLPDDDLVSEEELLGYYE